MKKLPLARTDNIVVQALGREVLVYDLNVHRAYNLNETAARVYQACDGLTTFEELRRRHKFTDDLIYLALEQLRDDNLLETDTPFTSPFGNVSRRDAIKKVGLATMIALPLISSLAAPTSAQASSLTNTICTAPSGSACNAQAECNAVAYCFAAPATGCTCTGGCCVECAATVCNNLCTDTTSDPNNCGTCGNVCTFPNFFCFNGTCVNPAA